MRKIVGVWASRPYFDKAKLQTRGTKTSPNCSQHPRGCRYGLCREVRENINPMFDLYKKVEVRTINSNNNDSVCGEIEGKENKGEIKC